MRRRNFRFFRHHFVDLTEMVFLQFWFQVAFWLFFRFYGFWQIFRMVFNAVLTWNLWFRLCKCCFLTFFCIFQLRFRSFRMEICFRLSWYGVLFFWNCCFLTFFMVIHSFFHILHRFWLLRRRNFRFRANIVFGYRIRCGFWRRFRNLFWCWVMSFLWNPEVILICFCSCCRFRKYLLRICKKLVPGDISHLSIKYLDCDIFLMEH